MIFTVVKQSLLNLFRRNVLLIDALIVIIAVNLVIISSSVTRQCQILASYVASLIGIVIAWMVLSH